MPDVAHPSMASTISEGHSTARRRSLKLWRKEWMTHLSGTLGFSHLLMAATDAAWGLWKVLLHLNECQFHEARHSAWICLITASGISSLFADAGSLGMKVPANMLEQFSPCSLIARLITDFTEAKTRFTDAELIPRSNRWSLMHHLNWQMHQLGQLQYVYKA